MLPIEEDELHLEVVVVQLDEAGPLDGRYMVKVMIFHGEDLDREWICDPEMARVLGAKLIGGAVQAEHLARGYFGGN